MHFPPRNLSPEKTTIRRFWIAAGASLRFRGLIGVRRGGLGEMARRYLRAAMEALLQELSAGVPDAAQVARVVVRLLAAALVGAVIGLQRERAGKPAGLRTHMLVALGAALFVVAATESGIPAGDLSRVLQGIATGIGFIGGGAILKLRDEREITGLTTAAGIWMTAAAGVAAGLGRWGAAAIAVILTWVILAALGKIEGRLERKRARIAPPTSAGT